jgi:hypothetical protein
MDKDTIKKAIYQIAKEPQMKGWKAAFNNLTGNNADQHNELLGEVIDELRHQNAITVQQLSPYSNGISVIQPSIHFDQLEREMNPQQNTPIININNASNFQAGNQNATMNIGMTPDELINVLNALLAKRPEEAKTIMNKLRDMVANGANITTVLTGLTGLLQ